jgi:hypothetical protein
MDSLDEGYIIQFIFEFKFFILIFLIFKLHIMVIQK